MLEKARQEVLFIKPSTNMVEKNYLKEITKH